MMKPLLYQSGALQKGCGSYLRPGGAELTRRIFELAPPVPTDRIIDIGCGRGTTLNMLHSQGFRQLFGVDRHPEFLQETGSGDAGDICRLCGDMTHLPIQDTSLDFLLCECAWNLSEQHISMREFARVLKPGGVLALADIFHQQPVPGEWPIESCLASARTIAETKGIVKQYGFTIEHLEDHSHILRQAAAEFILAHGSLHEFWYAVTGSRVAGDQLCTMTAASRPGLFILIGTRHNG